MIISVIKFTLIISDHSQRFKKYQHIISRIISKGSYNEIIE